jgi:type IV pilus assembly protein PilA
MKSMQKGFTLIELMIVVAIIAILAAIAIPQYQAYVIRSQVSRVMGEAGDQKVVVEDCLNNGAAAISPMVPGTANSNDPSCIETAASSDLQADTATPAGVPAINLAAAGANSSIVATFGRHANTSIANETLTWTRNGTTGAWTCSSTVPSQYAPPSCPNG